MFLTMMSERLFEFDTEPELLEAFDSFDDGADGLVKVEDMRKWLGELGDRMSEDEVYVSLSSSLLVFDPLYLRLLRGNDTDNPHTIDRQISQRSVHRPTRKLQLQGMDQST